MNLPKSIAFLLFILFISCSSDPCEEVDCNNGTCVDGSCQCDEGYTGPFCSQLACVNGTFNSDICECDDGSYGKLCEKEIVQGLYTISKLQLNECPLYAVQYDLSSPPNDPTVCGENSSGNEVCFNWTYTIRDDNEISRFQFNTVKNSEGENESTFFEFIHGTYYGNSEGINIKLENGEQYDLILEGDMVIRHRFPTDGGENCMWLEEYIRK